MITFFYRLLLRFRYPVSLPDDVASAIGINVPKFLSFEDLLKALTEPCFRPKKLKKFMSRHLVEKAFQKAQKKEHFRQKSLYSFYFNEGCLEFILHFDENSLLRRLYVQHKAITEDKELSLDHSFNIPFHPMAAAPPV